MTITPLLSALLAIAAQQPPQDPTPEDPRHGAAAEKEGAARLARIRDEISELGADPGWAGIYYHGDGMGVNVTVALAPRAGFVFTWSGCLGVYDRNYGTWIEKDGRLELELTFPNVRQGFRGLAPVLVPVRWGERRYLVASDRMLSFANAINGGGEPRDGAHGGVLLRSGDWRKPVEGRPEVPEEIAALLLEEPVAGTIVAVHESRVETWKEMRYRVSEATIDRGEQQGLREGLVVRFAREHGFFAGSGVVTEVSEQTARIRIRARVLEGFPAPEAEVGWKWSTRWKRER